MFLDGATPEKCYRLETYRSGGAVSATATSHQLRCYFISRCSFPKHAPEATKDSQGRTDIRKVSDPVFLEKVTANTLAIYQAVLWTVEARTGPVIEVFDVEGSREKRVVIGYRMGSTTALFSALSDLYHFYSLYASRKYVEQFANGITVVSLYLNPLPHPPPGTPPIEHAIAQVVKEASLLYCLPDNPFFRRGGGANEPQHAVQEATYACTFSPNSSFFFSFIRDLLTHRLP